MTSASAPARRRPAEIALVVLAVLLNVGFYLPSVPGEQTAGIPGLDKVYHAGVFALTVWAFGRLLAPQRRFPMGWVVIVAICHAPFIELIQAIALPDRDPDLGDVLADWAGVGIGLLAWWIERRRAALLILQGERREEALSPGAE